MYEINDNLNFLTEYDLYRAPEKYFYLHHDIFNYHIPTSNTYSLKSFYLK